VTGSGEDNRQLIPGVKGNRRWCVRRNEEGQEHGASACGLMDDGVLSIEADCSFSAALGSATSTV
jgi:hypothetical protein